MIAAVAWPLWQPAVAQDEASMSQMKPEVKPEFKMLSKQLDAKQVKSPVFNDVHKNSSEAPKNYQGRKSAIDMPDMVPSKAPKASAPTKTSSRLTTIADGNVTSAQIPVDGYNFDVVRTHSQLIYPSSMLTGIVGKKITAITFHHSDGIKFGIPAGSYDFGDVTVRMSTTTRNSFPSNNPHQTVSGGVSKTVTPAYGGNTMTIRFDQPFEYTSGNIIIDVAVTEAGQYCNSSDTKWLGQNPGSYQSIYYNGTNIWGNAVYTRVDFLPKITFEYEEPCDEIVIKDKSFFQGINYTWIKNGTGETKTNNLSEIATDPDQIIAMLQKVYMDKTIPGNLKRGFDVNGNNEPYNDVAYTGVGTITHTGGTAIETFLEQDNYSWNNGYGWNVPGDVVYGLDKDWLAYYAHLDSTQYKPNENGLTVLLVEMIDDFDIDEYNQTINSGTYNSSYDLLRTQILNSIKSVRVISEAKRTGEGLDAGTLFKIDCDKMNKFFLLAKGQMRYLFNSQQVFADADHYMPSATFSRLPLYAYSLYSDVYYLGDENNTEGGFMDYNCYEPFYHMFEQFSPYDLNNLQEVLDVYQDMKDMKSFGVEHDCASVPIVSPRGHHFRMYGEDSPSDDCQDVRDMMFFIPDYRMMKHDLRDANAIFLNYNPDHKPNVGLFVIHQKPIEGNQIDGQETYKLHLTWESNLMQFLPGDLGKYTLYRVITNADGTKTYTQVGNVFDSGIYEYYDDVEMQHNGQQVTYVVQGQDADGFLSLKMSNEESFIIPGLDRAEQIRIALNNDYYFSRYDAAEQKNYYSNSLIANNTIGTNVKPAYIENGTQFKFWRATIDEQTGNVVTPDEPFVVAEVSEWDPTTGGTLTYKDWNDQADFSGKPYKHGYHANVGTSTISIDTKNNQISTDDEVVFDGLKLYDNFSVDVSENAHPAQYVYYVTLETAVPFGLTDVPAIASPVEGKTYVYFERPVDWYDYPTVRVWAWIENGDGTQTKLTGETWPGNGNMTWVGRNNGNDVYLWAVDENVIPTHILFNCGYDFTAEVQTGNFEFTNGGYYNRSVRVGVSSASNISNQARSNTVSVPVYKTAMTMKPIKAQNVEADVTHQFPAATKFDVKARYSSINDILGYYIYRWADSDPEQPRTIYESDGADASPQGQAGNQSEYYTVAMNTDFTGRTENFGANYADVTASFEDNYMVNDADKADTYTYAPVVELFAPIQAVNLSDNTDRKDYNTYGGPQQMTAGGKIEVTVESSATTGDNGYEWTMNGSTYVYYNTLLKVNVLDLPAGYEVAKVRAWRKVNADNFLGEQAPTQNTPDYRYRANLDSNGEFMFSNYNTTNYDPEGYDIQEGGYIGGEEDNNHIMAGTFGGKKLENGEQVPMDFVVRIYFTKTGAKAGEQPYYIAEVPATDVLTSNIPTSITGVESYRNVISEKYYNPAGIESDTPFKGVNIVVTRYSDGSTTTTKILK